MFTNDIRDFIIAHLICIITGVLLPYDCTMVSILFVATTILDDVQLFQQCCFVLDRIAVYWKVFQTNIVITATSVYQIFQCVSLIGPLTWSCNTFVAESDHRSRERFYTL